MGREKNRKDTRFIPQTAYLELKLENLSALCDQNSPPPFLSEAKGQIFTHEPHLKITYVTLINFIIFHKLSFSHILK